MPVLLSDDQIHEVRAKIVAIAMRQAVEKGIEGVSMHGIARQMGWTATALYRYFDNKEAILAAARTHALNGLSDALEAARAGPGDSWDRSRAIGAAYVDFAFTQPDAYRLIFSLDQPDAAAYPELRAAQARSHRCMIGYVEDMVAEGQIDADPELLGHVFWAGLHGLISLNMTGQIGIAGRPDFETLRHEMVRRIVQGARAHFARDPDS